MNLWKRNAVVSVIVLFVFVALYLSWSYGRDPKDESLTVLDPMSLEQESGGDAAEPGSDPLDASLNNLSDAQEAEKTYFDEARLSRLQSRDSALAILTEATERDSVSQDVRDNASVEIEKLVSDAMTEVVIENLILAKGFAECVVFINQEGVKVIVEAPAGGMTEEDAAKLTDIVVSESGVSVREINIVPVSA